MNIIVTGAASGIGRKLTELLVGSGHFVFATDVDRRGLESAAADLGWRPPAVQIRSHDVRDSQSWRQLVDETVSHLGKLDILVNVAGVIRPAFVQDLDAEQIALQLDVNTKGVILGTQAAAAVMVHQRSGHIINVASMAGLAAIPGISVYCASKFAVRGFTLAVASELEKYGVFATCVCPDATDTPMLDYQIDFESAAMTFSAPKALTAEDVARVIVERVIVRKPLEVCIPWGRGLLARVSTSLPTFMMRGLLNAMTKRGIKAQRALAANRAKSGVE